MCSRVAPQSNAVFFKGGQFIPGLPLRRAPKGGCWVVGSNIVETATWSIGGGHRQAHTAAMPSTPQQPLALAQGQALAGVGVWPAASAPDSPVTKWENLFIKVLTTRARVVRTKFWLRRVESLNWHGRPEVERQCCACSRRSETCEKLFYRMLLRGAQSILKQASKKATKAFLVATATTALVPRDE